MSTLNENLKQDVSELLEKYKRQVLTLSDINAKIPEVLAQISCLLGNQDFSILNPKSLQRNYPIFINGTKNYCTEAQVTKLRQKTGDVNMLLEDSPLSPRLPCDSCEKRSSCQSLCEKAEAVLSSVHEGRGRRENLTEFYDDTLQGKEIVRRKDIFEKYVPWKKDFTAGQWAVFEMYYQDGLTEDQIAKKVGKARTTISGLLNRAKKRMEDRDRQLRQETREEIKKMAENDEI